jgi:hypothetical protein
MPKHTAHHAGHARDAFKEDESRQPFLLSHLKFDFMLLTQLRVPVARHAVHSPTQHLYST